MGARESLNKNRPLAIILTVVMVTCAVGVIYWANGNPMPSERHRAFYSDDDGKTYFEDDSNKVCPFDHNGKPAVRAFVFRFGSGKPFVSYLSRFSDADRNRLEELKAKPMTQEVAQSISGLANAAMQVKKPGAEKWLQGSSPAGNAVMTSAPPSGESGEFSSVDP